MKKDISTRTDLHLIVTVFYEFLLENDNVKHFFVEFTEANKLAEHLDVLVDFWDNTLFYSGSYKKNAIRPHIKIHQEKTIKPEHFDTWLKLFNQAVDRNFEGPNSITIKSRALSIATVMKLKIGLH